jgi:hypothetical protein
MSDAAHHRSPVSETPPTQPLWSERPFAALSRFCPRIARADIDLLVTLMIFSGVGLVASLVLLILDHQLNGQLPNL